MSDDIAKIINDFRATRWEAKPYDRVVRLLEEDPAQAEMVVRSIISDLRENPTFLHYAIDCLPDSAFPAMAPFAVDAFRKNSGNQAAADFISRISLQSPASLHPYLDNIFALKPNWTTYHAQWPWRESGKSHLAFLENIARGGTAKTAIRKLFKPGSGNDSEDAVSAMLETRHPEAFAFVWRRQGEKASHHFPGVGFEGGDQNFRKLYSDTSFHIGFPDGYFKDEKDAVHLVKRNRTWHLPAAAYPAIFGGEGSGDCQNCGGTLHNLVTIPTIPPGMGVTSLPALSLQTCLSCLGWEVDTGALFYEHDHSGGSTSLNQTKTKIKPKFPAVPLRSAKVDLCPTPKRWQWQDWALSNNRENLNRLGGFPAWIQNSDYLTCPKCSNRMCHLMQLDSELPTSDGKGWLWGSGGCCYVGWCDNCKVSGFQWQCT